MKIIYVAHKEIDKIKWDNCIEHSVNRLIYPRSFYLDALTKWDALVSGDYKAVMPLPFRTKWGITYLYQPAFIQQAGIYSVKKLTAQQVRLFLDTAFQHFKFAEITLNFGNEIKEYNDSERLSFSNNFILDLSLSYEKLYAAYLPSFTKSLRRIKKFSLQYHESGDYAKQVKLYRSLYSNRLSSFSAKDFTGFTTICKKMYAEDSLVIRYVCTSENELLASIILLKDGNRLYNIISCITATGKKYEANYFLYDGLIREFAGTKYILDLEGSDQQGIMNFYRKFNPVNQSYPYIKFNKLPAIFRLLKS